MDSTGTIWAALDCDKEKAMDVADKVGLHPAIRGFKVNRLVDQEVFRPDGERRLFEALDFYGKDVWADLKLIDIPVTVANRIAPYFDDEKVNYITVMAKGGIKMMMDAVEAGKHGSIHAEIRKIGVSIIAVTELTSLSEEEVHLLSGQPARASVINLARMAVLSDVNNLVCSGKELAVLGSMPELAKLKKFVPAIKPAWSLSAGVDQKRVVTPEVAFKNGASALVIGRAIVDAEDPAEAVQRTADEIEAIEI